MSGWGGAYCASVSETLTTSEAAAVVGVSVQHYLRLAERLGVEAALQAPGLRGAKFWRSEDVDRIAAERAA